MHTLPELAEPKGGPVTKWWRYNKTGREHLADCSHMSDAPGWPDAPWGDSKQSMPTSSPANPCESCLLREAKEGV